MQGVFNSIRTERRRQDKKWGSYHSHPNGTCDTPERVAYMEMAKAVCQYALGKDLTWFNILREEVAEVGASPNDLELRKELVQVAAVAVAWIEALDRQHRPGLRQ
jgi:hypothetical protein